MSQLEIITNRQDRFFLQRDEVPDRIVRDDYDHLDEDEAADNWIKYKGRFYHVSDFMRDPPGLLHHWHGYLSDSFFSGLVIKIADDGETYQIGTYIG